MLTAPSATAPLDGHDAGSAMHWRRHWTDTMLTAPRTAAPMDEMPLRTPSRNTADPRIRPCRSPAERMLEERKAGEKMVKSRRKDCEKRENVVPTEAARPSIRDIAIPRWQNRKKRQKKRIFCTENELVSIKNRFSNDNFA
jgi:hypothetical protein